MNEMRQEKVVNKQNIEHKIHGKCMCEACNCGRHHCPDPIKHGEYNSSYAADYPKHEGVQPNSKYNMIQKNFILPEDKFNGESSYVGDYSKRSKMDPVHKFVPKGELQLSKDPFRANTSYIDDYLNRGVAQRATPTKHPKNQILPEGRFEGGSNYHDNFIGSATKRPDQFKPVGELKTGDGNFEGVSSYNSDFEKKGNAIRAERVTHPKNQVMPEGRFEGHSNYADNYIPSKGEKLKQFKPEGQIKVGGNFEGASSYNADFSSRGPGAKAERVPLPRNQVLPEGKFNGDSEYHQTFIPSQHQRQKQFKPEGQLKVGGQPFIGGSSYIADYLNKGTIPRAQKVPLPKNQVIPEGKFAGDSNYHENYLNSKSERTAQFRPQGELKVGDGMFEGKSSYGADYENRGAGIRNERVPLPRNQVIPDGRFEGNSAYTSDYLNSKVEKMQQIRPIGELKVGEGKFEGNSSYTNDYLSKGAAMRAERVPLPKNQVMPEGRFEGGSNYAENYMRRENLVREKCPCDQFKAPRTQYAEKQHVRYNENLHKWE